MNRELKMSYETMGSSSYMTVSCPPEIKLVNYELEMILSNEIRNFLSVSRQMLNGEMVIYYNITSRISLKQVLDKRKLSRKELFSLIDGAITAIREAAAYRLPAAGIALEPEYIYVNPASCAPAFMFMPLQEPAGPGIRELFSDLILHDRIELSDDNFVQIFLRELNRQPFSLDQLEQSLKPYEMPEQIPAQGMREGNTADPQAVNRGTVNPQMENSQMTNQRGTNPLPLNPPPVNWPPMNPQSGDSQPFNPASMNIRPELSQSGMPSSQSLPPYPSGLGEAPYPAGAGEPVYPSGTGESPSGSSLGRGKARPGLPSVSKGKEESGKKKAEKRKTLRESKKENDDNSQKDFDPEKAKKKFLLPQALVMIVTAAAVSFGFFTEKSGGIAINNVLAFVIVIALAEVILYREIYINSKTSGKKKDSSKAKTNEKGQAKRKDLARPEPLRRPEPPQMVNQKPMSPPPLNSQPANQQAMNRQPTNQQPMNVRSSNPQMPPHQAASQVISPIPVNPQSASSQPISSIPSMQQSVSPQFVTNPVYGQQPIPQYPLYGGTEDTDLISDTEQAGNGMPAYLEYYEEGRLNRIPLDSVNGAVIGRLKQQVDFAVKSPKVGKVHAKFFGQGTQYYVVDINSKNGTYINGSGTRIESNVPYPLHDKDRIILADCEFVIRCSDGC